ncbi:hypothetical protein LPTSP4_09040 [Leptospira ryugenii]|uniref:Uncharacterized protein n=1 Tax=Leptospira ryugenii TaxID=1917863 RepID=A0A2P2DXN9_9LEPT|nr:hypothetical protein [Leptospira ryugenii]GBF49391.1 hypothetical protein LPTSP4_09040 [Leptospira ryugenii]
MRQNGIYPTDSDVLGSILYKAKETNYLYVKRLNVLKLKERSNQEEREFRLLSELVENLTEDEKKLG